MDVFESEARKIKGAEFLAQGTLYPDVIESKSAFGGPTSVIKSHHNVGGLPKKMKLKLVEPLKYLFKDEVRKLGKTLNLHEDLIWRQPFPGPGLAVRIIGDITRKRLEILRENLSCFFQCIDGIFAVAVCTDFVGIFPCNRSAAYHDFIMHPEIHGFQVLNYFFLVRHSGCEKR